MRVSKLSCLNGPEPEAVKLLIMGAEAPGSGSLAKIAAAAGDIMLLGMQLPVQPVWGPNAVRPDPSGAALLVGSKACPPPWTPAAEDRYSLRSQYPVVSLKQVDRTRSVGSVNWP